MPPSYRNWRIWYRCYRKEMRRSSMDIFANPSGSISMKISTYVGTTTPPFLSDSNICIICLVEKQRIINSKTTIGALLGISKVLICSSMNTTLPYHQKCFKNISNPSAYIICYGRKHIIVRTGLTLQIHHPVIPSESMLSWSRCLRGLIPHKCRCRDDTVLQTSQQSCNTPTNTCKTFFKAESSSITGTFLR